MRRSAAAAVLWSLLLASLGPGCARSRTFTIYSKPADAKLVINGVERGAGPITQRFLFNGSGDSVRVMAVREGYQARTERLTPNLPRDTVVIELQRLSPRAIVSVEPAAMIRVNGELYQTRPVRQAEIPFDPTAPDKTYTIIAEQRGYEREVRTISGKDRQGYYRIVLRPLSTDDAAVALAQPQVQPQVQPQAPPARPLDAAPDAPMQRPATRESPQVPQPSPTTRAASPAPAPAPAPAPPPNPTLRRTVVIHTEPPVAGAEIYVGDEKRGDNSVELVNHPFQRDPVTGRSVPQKVRATAPGFEGGEVSIRWEDERQDYVIPLGRRRKDIRIATDPPGAVVTLNGRVLSRDAAGLSFYTLDFPPADPPDKPTTFTAAARAADPSAAYESAQLNIGWDEGRRDYAIKLPPSRVVKVPLLRAAPAWEQRGGWRAMPTRVETLAMRDVSEARRPGSVTPLTELPAGTMLDSVIASPDGSLVLYTELIAGQGSVPLRSRMRLLDSDGAPGPTLPSDGKHFDAMPSFTPDGGEIIFTSDRAGDGLDVWSMKVAGAGAAVGASAGAVRQIARGGEKAGLWPMIDASPRPRLFYEAFLKPAVRASESRSEVHVVELEAEPPTNKALSPGMRPRASPRADAVVFTRLDPATGKRDLYMISDKDGAPLGGIAVNLTRTPDVDECDPAWSRTGGKIAYSSDGGSDDTNRRNYDLYVLSVADPQHPVRVTSNGSWDDSPAWDPTAKALYFRSNRGGKWGIWKAAVP